MKRYSRNWLRNAEKSEMMQIVLHYLNKHNIRVRKWMPYNGRKPGEKVVYEAFFETEQVTIPVPIDKYSFYVCMHEIGHIVKGYRRLGYHMEYVAEQWAIAKCKKHGYYTKQIEQGAKYYVYCNLIEDVVFRCLHPEDVKQEVMDWIGCDVERIRKDALRVGKKLLKKRIAVPSYFTNKTPANVEAYKVIIRMSMQQLTY